MTKNSVGINGADQPPYRVHFCTDGTGQAIRWKIVATEAESRAPQGRRTLPAVHFAGRGRGILI